MHFSPVMVSDPSTPSLLPAFDPTQLLLLMQDGEEHKAMVVELLASVLKNGAAPLDAARRSWSEGNAGHASRQLHTARGSLGTFGLRRFAAAALAAEQALHSRQAGAESADSAITALLDAASQALQQGLADMRAWLAAQGVSLS